MNTVPENYWTPSDTKRFMIGRHSRNDIHDRLHTTDIYRSASVSTS
jgi:hypothetical protein